jgi:hypothetical protein
MNMKPNSPHRSREGNGLSFRNAFVLALCLAWRLGALRGTCRQ